MSNVNDIIAQAENLTLRKETKLIRLQFKVAQEKHWIFPFREMNVQDHSPVDDPSIEMSDEINANAWFLIKASFLQKTITHSLKPWLLLENPWTNNHHSYYLLSKVPTPN